MIMKNLNNQITIDTLSNQLTKASIDTSTWGTGQTKTVAHLHEEIQSGETILTPGENDKLLREVIVGNADIFYQSPNGKKYRLKEDKQVFKDGRERRRNLGHAVSEKMKADEEPIVAMIRGIQEELGINSELKLVKLGTEILQEPSPSYPGLESNYVFHTFEVTLTDEQFNPAGYVEEQTDKSTYFVWEEVD